MVRIFIHPYYEVNHGEVRESNKHRATDKIVTSSNEKIPPLLIFEEEDMVNKTLSRLKGSNEQVYIVETNNNTSDPKPQAFMKDTSEGGRWQVIVDTLKDVGVKKVLIGGEKLSMIEGDISSYSDPNLDFFRQQRAVVGAKKTDYNFLGCVGQAITMLSKGGIAVDISNLTSPQSRMDVLRYEQKINN